MTHYYGVELEFSAALANSGDCTCGCHYDCQCNGYADAFDNTTAFFQSEVRKVARRTTCPALPERFRRFRNWEIVEDSSAETRGFGLELRSPVLSDARFKQLKAVFNMFRANQERWSRDYEFEIAQNAHGLHVHFDTRIYTRDNIVNLLKLWTIVESPLMGVSIATRREQALDEFAQLIAPDVLDNIGYDEPDTIVDRLVDEATYSRYKALNFSEKLRPGKGTVELRAPGATLNTNYLWSWIQVMKALIRSSKYGRQVSSSDLVKLVTSSDNYRNTWQLERAKQASYRLLRWTIAPRFMDNHTLTRHIETLSTRGI